MWTVRRLCEGIRTDSPTVDVEGLNLLCSFASCKKLRIKAADIRNAYFNAEALDRLLLLRLPNGGLPGMDNSKKYAIAARVPIYGTQDAGRQFYKKFRKVATTAGWTECRSLKSFYYLQVDGDLKVILAAHVDDLIWACEEGYESEVEKIFGCFEIKKIEEGKFRFCGREYNQLEDFSIKVTCKDNTENSFP